MKMRVLFGLTAVVVDLVAALDASAMPVFQPTVKEYKALGGSFEARRLPVFHQDQRQCEIAADETFVTGGKAVWDGASCAAKGIYIAVAGYFAGAQVALIVCPYRHH